MVGDVLFVEKGLNNYGELIKSIQGHEGFEATEINLKLIISGFIDDISRGKQTFFGLVGCLESLLVSTDLSKHNVGLDVLARVVQDLPQHFFNSIELERIIQFFCNQIKQHHAFLSTSLKGLLALVKVSLLSKESLHEIVNVLIYNVVWQTQPQVDRHGFYNLLQYITFNRLEDFKSTSSELLFDIISSVDGERDPRNLLLLFSFLPRLYTTFPLGALAEDAFEVVSCYFPIDFHPSSNNPDSVTREDLVEALTPCLLAVPEFTHYCLPLIQEKLDSTLMTAKIDSYKLLIEGCRSWESGTLEAHTEGIWKSIVQDTLPPRDTQTADFAIQALQALVRATPESTLMSLINNIIYRCEGFLANAQMSLFGPAFRLILATMEASPLACSTVCHQLLPKIVSLLQVSEDASKLLVLKNSYSVIGICLSQKLPIDSEAEGWKGLQVKLVESLQIGVTDVKEAALKALTEFIPCSSQDIRSMMYPCIVSILTSGQPVTFRHTCIKCLQSLAVTFEHEVQSHIIEHLLIKGGIEEDVALKELKFGAICSLGVVGSYHSVLEGQFVWLMADGSSSASVAVSCLKTLLEDVEVQQNYALINFLFAKSSVLKMLTSAVNTENQLINAATIIQILIRFQDTREQERVVAPLVTNLLHHLNPCHQMILLESLLCPLRPDVPILTESLEDITKVIVSVINSVTENSLLVDSALRLMAVLINKTNNEHFLQVMSDSLNHVPSHRTTFGLAYITKALAIRGHPVMESWVNKLLDRLDEQQGGEVAAEGVKLLVEESDRWLSHQNHCEVRLLYRQRLFTLICPRLVASSRTVQHLKSLAYLMQAVPRTVYEREIVELLPLLILSLDMDSEQLLLTVLSTLANLLISDNRVLLESHIDTFIPRFLKLATNSMFMKVRIAALKCVSNTLKFSSTLLLPHKQKVISDLVPCLDDKKRLVRKEAAVARSKWFLLGAPTPN